MYNVTVTGVYCSFLNTNRTLENAFLFFSYLSVFLKLFYVSVLNISVHMAELFLLDYIPIFPRTTRNFLSFNTQASFTHLLPNMLWLSNFNTIFFNCIFLVVTKDNHWKLSIFAFSFPLWVCCVYISLCQLRITHACFMSNANYKEDMLLFLSAPVCSLPWYLSLFLSITLLNINAMLLRPCFNFFSCHFVQTLLSLKCLYDLWNSLLVFMFSVILISRK